MRVCVEGKSLHYVIESNLSDTDHVVKTPDRKQKSCVCHVNMPKPYISCATTDVNSSVPVVTSVAAASMSIPPSEYSPEVDGLSLGRACFPCAQLPNSEWLANIQSKLAHLSEPAQGVLISLLRKYPSPPPPFFFFKYPFSYYCPQT